MDMSEVEREHDATILAKALYDNLADAPDELSFRKGDIVTVIEQDVDGLVGWWLCILHGRQGIAPGNRLQVLSESDRKNVKRSFRRGSYSTDDFSDSHDGSWTSDVSPSLNLDFDTGVPSSNASCEGLQGNKLSVKELYDIPLGHGGDTLRRGLSLLQSHGLETCDLPTTLPRGARMPNTIQLSAGHDQLHSQVPFTNQPSGPKHSQPRSTAGVQEIYDAPRLTNKDSAELYDVPNSHPNNISTNATPFDVENQTLYDVPLHTGTPHRGRSYNISTASPPGTPKSPRASEFSRIPQPNAIGAVVKEAPANYDVPRKVQQYDTPRRHTNPQELYDVPPKTHQIEAEELYDVPSKGKGNSLRGTGACTLPALSTRAPPEELYDIPVKNSVGLGKPSNVGIKNHHNEEHKHGTEEKPIYNKPPSLNGQGVRNTKVAHNNNEGEIYNSPLSYGQKGTNVQSEGHKREVYDVPSRKISGMDEVYDVPPPTSHHEGPSEIYDTPSKQTLIRSDYPGFGEVASFAAKEKASQEELYDTPPVHDVNKVMAAIGINEARERLVKAAGSGSRDSDEDDYVDYEDIYGREPPSYLMKAMHKPTSSSSTNTAASPAARPPGPKRQQSVLEQINMDAVRELTINSSQALDRLAKLHLAVDTSVTTLLGFAEDDWLNPVDLNRNIGAIRDMAGKVKIALRLLTEFGLGALVNAKKSAHAAELVESINSNVEPLVESYYKIKVCLLHLDGSDWAVPAVRDPETERFFATVNAIMILSERIPENCRRLNAVIQTNLRTIFSPVENTTPAERENVSQGNRNSQGSVRHDVKGKLKQLGPVDPKTVRGILDIDHRMSFQASPNIHNNKRGTLSGESGSGTLRRRQEIVSTIVPRPPVPPKPSLPNNRKSLAVEAPDALWVKSPVSSRIETLVTEYAVESPRIKYNSDPTRSPIAFEKNKDPALGGSCPSLQSQHLPVTERGLLNTAGSEEPLPNSASQGDMDKLKPEKRQSVTLGRKLPSESNIHDPELAPSSPLHSRSASVPYDERDAKFPSLELGQPDVQEKVAPKVAKLDHRDIETLEFFLRQVEAQVMILRGAMKNLTESVEKNSIPQVFVAHSKFVILTAHKVVHAAEEVTERLIDQDVCERIRRENVHLTDNIRAVVAATKKAALEYPSGKAMGDMIGSVVSLGESVRDIHGEAKRALAL